MAAWYSDMFPNFYLVKNHIIDKNSRTTNAREKIDTDLDSLEFLAIFWQMFDKIQKQSNFS
jgi:hypothetical protein